MATEKKKEFIFSEKLAFELVRIPEDRKRAAFAYAMNYGLGRMPAANDEMFDPITREVDRANAERTNVSREDVRAIVEHLNDVCETAFRPSSEKTRRLINARYGEGFTLDDFRMVIDHKHREWEGTSQEQYLRPETLFGPKFEGYLQAARREVEKGQSEGSFEASEFFAAALAKAYGGAGNDGN